MIESALEPAEEKIMSIVLMREVDVLLLDKVSNYDHLKRIYLDATFHTQLPSPTQCSGARDGGSPKYRGAKLGRDVLAGFGPRAALPGRNLCSSKQRTANQK